MAGRGRARGRGRGSGMGFDADQLGLRRGEVIPAMLDQPLPTFPPLVKKWLKLPTGQRYDYLQLLVEDHRAIQKELPYFLETKQKPEIEYYSDKVKSSAKKVWTPDYSRVPGELMPRKKQKLATKSGEASNVRTKDSVDVVKKLEELEKNDKDDETEEVASPKKETAEKEEDEDEEKEKNDDDEVLDEDELEEENDYGESYFDNGEGYLDEEEDNLDDGPTY